MEQVSEWMMSFSHDLMVGAGAGLASRMPAFNNKTSWMAFYALKPSKLCVLLRRRTMGIPQSKKKSHGSKDNKRHHELLKSIMYTLKL